jgi:hypothetical protein
MELFGTSPAPQDAAAPSLEGRGAGPRAMTFAQCKAEQEKKAEQK